MSKNLNKLEFKKMSVQGGSSNNIDLGYRYKNSDSFLAQEEEAESAETSVLSNLVLRESLSKSLRKRAKLNEMELNSFTESSRNQKKTKKKVIKTWRHNSEADPEREPSFEVEINQVAPTPRLSDSSDNTIQQPSLVDRIPDILNNKESKLRYLKRTLNKQRAQDLQKECTFKPKINKKTEQILRNGSIKRRTVEDLYNWNKAKEMRMVDNEMDRLAQESSSSNLEVRRKGGRSSMRRLGLPQKRSSEESNEASGSGGEGSGEAKKTSVEDNGPSKKIVRNSSFSFGGGSRKTLRRDLEDQRPSEQVVGSRRGPRMMDITEMSCEKSDLSVSLIQKIDVRIEDFSKKDVKREVEGDAQVTPGDEKGSPDHLVPPEKVTQRGSGKKKKVKKKGKKKNKKKLKRANNNDGKQSGARDQQPVEVRMAAPLDLPQSHSDVDGDALDELDVSMTRKYSKPKDHHKNRSRNNNNWNKKDPSKSKRRVKKRSKAAENLDRKKSSRVKQYLGKTKQPRASNKPRSSPKGLKKAKNAKIEKSEAIEPKKTKKSQVRPGLKLNSKRVKKRVSASRNRTERDKGGALETAGAKSTTRARKNVGGKMRSRDVKRGLKDSTIHPKESTLRPKSSLRQSKIRKKVKKSEGVKKEKRRRSEAQSKPMKSPRGQKSLKIDSFQAGEAKKHGLGNKVDSELYRSIVQRSYNNDDAVRHQPSLNDGSHHQNSQKLPEPKNPENQLSGLFETEKANYASLRRDPSHRMSHGASSQLSNHWKQSENGREKNHPKTKTRQNRASKPSPGAASHLDSSAKSSRSHQSAQKLNLKHPSSLKKNSKFGSSGGLHEPRIEKHCLTRASRNNPPSSSNLRNHKKWKNQKIEKGLKHESILLNNYYRKVKDYAGRDKDQKGDESYHGIGASAAETGFGIFAQNSSESEERDRLGHKARHSYHHQAQDQPGGVREHQKRHIHSKSQSMFLELESRLSAYPAHIQDRIGVNEHSQLQRSSTNSHQFIQKNPNFRKLKNTEKGQNPSKVSSHAHNPSNGSLQESYIASGSARGSQSRLMKKTSSRTFTGAEMSDYYNAVRQKRDKKRQKVPKMTKNGKKKKPKSPKKQVSKKINSGQKSSRKKRGSPKKVVDAPISLKSDQKSEIDDDDSDEHEIEINDFRGTTGTKWSHSKRKRPNQSLGGRSGTDKQRDPEKDQIYEELVTKAIADKREKLMTRSSIESLHKRLKELHSFENEPRSQKLSIAKNLDFGQNLDSIEPNSSKGRSPASQESPEDDADSDKDSSGAYIRGSIFSQNEKDFSPDRTIEICVDDSYDRFYDSSSVASLPRFRKGEETKNVGNGKILKNEQKEQIKNNQKILQENDAPKILPVARGPSQNQVSSQNEGKSDKSSFLFLLTETSVSNPLMLDTGVSRSRSAATRSRKTKNGLDSGLEQIQESQQEMGHSTNLGNKNHLSGSLVCQGQKSSRNRLKKSSISTFEKIEKIVKNPEILEDKTTDELAGVIGGDRNLQNTDSEPESDLERKKKMTHYQRTLDEYYREKARKRKIKEQREAEKARKELEGLPEVEMVDDDWEAKRSRTGKSGDKGSSEKPSVMSRNPPVSKNMGDVAKGGVFGPKKSKKPKKAGKKTRRSAKARKLQKSSAGLSAGSSEVSGTVAIREIKKFDFGSEFEECAIDKNLASFGVHQSPGDPKGRLSADQVPEISKKLKNRSIDRLDLQEMDLDQLRSIIYQETQIQEKRIKGSPSNSPKKPRKLKNKKKTKQSPKSNKSNKKHKIEKSGNKINSPPKNLQQEEETPSSRKVKKISQVLGQLKRLNSIGSLVQGTSIQEEMQPSDQQFNNPEIETILAKEEEKREVLGGEEDGEREDDVLSSQSLVDSIEELKSTARRRNLEAPDNEVQRGEEVVRAEIKQSKNPLQQDLDEESESNAVKNRKESNLRIEVSDENQVISEGEADIDDQKRQSRDGMGRLDRFPGSQEDSLMDSIEEVKKSSRKKKREVVVEDRIQPHQKDQSPASGAHFNAPSPKKVAHKKIEKSENSFNEGIQKAYWNILEPKSTIRGLPPKNPSPEIHQIPQNQKLKKSQKNNYEGSVSSSASSSSSSSISSPLYKQRRPQKFARPLKKLGSNLRQKSVKPPSQSTNLGNRIPAGRTRAPTSTRLRQKHRKLRLQRKFAEIEDSLLDSSLDSSSSSPDSQNVPKPQLQLPTNPKNTPIEPKKAEESPKLQKSPQMLKNASQASKAPSEAPRQTHTTDAAESDTTGQEAIFNLTSRGQSSFRRRIQDELAETAKLASSRFGVDYNLSSDEETNNDERSVQKSLGVASEFGAGGGRRLGGGVGSSRNLGDLVGSNDCEGVKSASRLLEVASGHDLAVSMVDLRVMGRGLFKKSKAVSGHIEGFGEVVEAFDGQFEASGSHKHDFEDKNSPELGVAYNDKNDEIERSGGSEGDSLGTGHPEDSKVIAEDAKNQLNHQKRLNKLNGEIFNLEQLIQTKLKTELFETQTSQDEDLQSVSETQKHQKRQNSPKQNLNKSRSISSRSAEFEKLRLKFGLSTEKNSKILQKRGQKPQKTGIQQNLLKLETDRSGVVKDRRESGPELSPMVEFDSARGEYQTIQTTQFEAENTERSGFGKQTEEEGIDVSAISYQPETRGLRRRRDPERCYTSSEQFGLEGKD